MWNVVHLVFNLEQNLGIGTLEKPEILHRKERNEWEGNILHCMYVQQIFKI